MEFIYYKRCNTCKKAMKHIECLHPDLREITENTPTYDELKTFMKMQGKGIKPFFNTSGKVYRDMHLKDKVKDMSEDEACELLSQNPLLIKRPILIDGDTILVGYKEKEYDAFINDHK